MNEHFENETSKMESTEPNMPKQKVSIASLKEKMQKEELLNTQETEDKEEQNENNDNLITLTDDDKLCPEGYIFKNNGCKKECKSCKLGKCKYGICGLQ